MSNVIQLRAFQKIDANQPLLDGDMRLQKASAMLMAANQTLARARPMAHLPANRHASQFRRAPASTRTQPLTTRFARHSTRTRMAPAPKFVGTRNFGTTDVLMVPSRTRHAGPVPKVDILAALQERLEAEKVIGVLNNRKRENALDMQDNIANLARLVYARGRNLRYTPLT